MANPTTNYSWPMPTSTDLVTDLPADFALFGQPVDTSLKALNPETTLGDISFRSSTSNTNTRLGIGTAGQVLAVSGGVPAWTTTADVTPLTTKGDLFTFTTVDARVGVGANNTVLTADSAEASGLKWATPSSGTKIGQVVQTFLSTTFSTASSSYTDLTGLSVSITPTLSSSKILIFVSITQSTSTGSAGNTLFQILRGSTAIGNSTGVSVVSFSGLAGAMMPTSGSIDTNCVFLDSPATTSATTYKIQMKNDGGYTAYINRRGADTNSGGVSTITVMEVVV